MSSLTVHLSEQARLHAAAAALGSLDRSVATALPLGVDNRLVAFLPDLQRVSAEWLGQ